jgi:hypothetical protein
LAKASVSPLSVLMRSMNKNWDLGGVDDASVCARTTAPYLHAKTTAAFTDRGLEQLTEEELDELCAAAEIAEDEAGESS